MKTIVHLGKKLSELNRNAFLGRLVRVPLRVIPGNQIIRVMSGLNKGARWIKGSSIPACWMGNYEAEKQQKLVKLVNPGMTIWDVGANAGFYTLCLSRLAGKSGRVYAFEPFAENAANLLRHVLINKLENTTVVQAALSAKDGLTGFDIGFTNLMGRASDGVKTYRVPALSADGFIKSEPVSRPDLLKIDIEGGEADFLLGAEKYLRNAAPEILLALHGESQERKCVELLKDYGYSI